MCPFCLANLGLIVASAVSTSGLAAVAVKVMRNNKNLQVSIPNQNGGEPENGKP